MYTTEGIILKKIDAGEADAFFTIYTKDFGKIRALAQGVKKSTAKLKGHLEALNFSAVSFVLGRRGERLTQATLIESWPSVRANYDKFVAAYQVADLFDKGCLVGEKDEPLWNLLHGALDSLEVWSDFSEKARDDFLRGFELRLSHSLGYGPEAHSWN